jgi:hypothetical protein
MSRGICLDVSEGRMGAPLQSDMMGGEAVEIDLQLPHYALCAVAIVRQASSTRSGFEFLGLTPEERRQNRGRNGRRLSVLKLDGNSKYRKQGMNEIRTIHRTLRRYLHHRQTRSCLRDDSSLRRTVDKASFQECHSSLTLLQRNMLAAMTQDLRHPDQLF